MLTDFLYRRPLDPESGYNTFLNSTYFAATILASTIPLKITTAFGLAAAAVTLPVAVVALAVTALGYNYMHFPGSEKSLRGFLDFVKKNPIIDSEELCDPRLERLRPFLEKCLSRDGTARKIKFFDLQNPLLPEKLRWGPQLSSHGTFKTKEGNREFIGVQREALDLLTPNELEAGLTHEITHQIETPRWLRLGSIGFAGFSIAANLYSGNIIPAVLLGALQGLLISSWDRAEEFRADRGSVFFSRKPRAASSGIRKLCAAYVEKQAALSPKKPKQYNIEEMGSPTNKRRFRRFEVMARVTPK